MPYFKHWDEYSKAVEQMYMSNPSRCRLVVKYRHCDGSMVLKMTDDSSCLMYRTDQLQDIKRLEKLTNSLIRQMTSNK